MKRLLFLCLIGVYQSVLAKDSDCDALKNAVFSDRVPDKNWVASTIEREISRDLKCAKNLLGRMYAEGRVFDVDKDRSYAIFYDLSQAGYPPAQYNLAYLMSERSDVKPQVVLGYLQGFISLYIADEKYGYLVPKATDLGRVYLDKLKYGSLEVEGLRDDFESVVRRANTNAAIDLVRKTKERRGTEDAIVGVLALGMALSEVSSALRSAHVTSQGSQAVPAPAWMGYRGIIGPSSGFRSPAWTNYPGIVGPNILYQIR
jgi:hypothetical protein